jgi:hypothetical protein
VNKALQTSPLRPTRSKLIPQLDALLERRDTHVRVIAKAAERKARHIQKANDLYDEEVGRSESALKEVDEELARFMERHHYPLTRLLSKTIKRDHGRVYEVLRSKELDLPASEESLIAHLLADDEGKQFVKVTYSLDKKALSAAFAKGEVSSRLKKALFAMGAWFGKHRTFLVQSASEGKQKTISRRRFNERKR